MEYPKVGELVQERLEEITCNLTLKDSNEVVKVSPFNSTNEPGVWFDLFRNTFPSWSRGMEYQEQWPRIDDLRGILLEQEAQIPSLNLKSLRMHEEEDSSQLSDETSRLQNILKLGKGDKIVDVSEVDVHPVTERGVVGITAELENGYRRVILCEYPSWRVITTLNLNLNWKLKSIQTIQAPAAHRNESAYITLLTLAVGRCLVSELVCFRLHSNNQVQYVGKMRPNFPLGRSDVFYYSQTPDNTSSAVKRASEVERVSDWLSVLCPLVQFDPKHTLFATVFDYDRTLFFKFDLRNSASLGHKIHFGIDTVYGGPQAEEFHESYLPMAERCARHVRIHPELDHLVTVDGYTDGVQLENDCSDELLWYDWRFGIKVGSLPREGATKNRLHFPVDFSKQQKDEPFEDEHREGGSHEGAVQDDEPPRRQKLSSVFYKAVTVLPLDSLSGACTKNEADLGLRLVISGHNINEDQTLQAWNISHMLDVRYDPLADEGSFDESEIDHEVLIKAKEDYEWWERGTSTLKRFAIGTYNTHLQDLPYTPAKGSKPMLVHYEFKDDRLTRPVFHILKSSVAFLVKNERLMRQELVFVNIETGKTLRRIDVKPEARFRILDNNDVFVFGSDTVMHGVMNPTIDQKQWKEESFIWKVAQKFLS